MSFSQVQVSIEFGEANCHFCVFGAQLSEAQSIFCVFQLADVDERFNPTNKESSNSEDDKSETSDKIILPTHACILGKSPSLTSVKVTNLIMSESIVCPFIDLQGPLFHKGLRKLFK